MINRLFQITVSRWALCSIVAVIAVSVSSCKKDLLERGSSGGDLGFAKAACVSSPSTTYNVQSFGAIPNDGLDDTEAFILAAQAVQAACSPSARTVLYVPAGVYTVGRQLAPGTSWTVGTHTYTNPVGGPARLGIDIINIKCCPNVTIRGTTGSIIRFRDGMDYGWNSGCSTTSSYGVMINLFGCDCAIIEYLDLDGRNQFCNLLTPCTDAYQIAYDGIVIGRSTDLTIRNTRSHHHGRDGLMFWTPNGPWVCPGSQEIDRVNISSFTSDFNSRQGFSLTAGKNITVTSSAFNNTGNIFYNNPGAGVDLEPDYANVVVDNVKFLECRFIGNRVFGIVSDTHPNVQNVTFRTSTIAQNTGSGYAAWVTTGRNFTFEQCIIHGTLVHAGGYSATQPHTMKACTITDAPYLGAPTFILGGLLLNVGPGDAHNRFSGCTFDLYRNKLGFVEGAGSNANAYTRIFSDNLFRFNYAQLQCPPSTVPVNSCGAIGGCSSRQWIAFLRHCHFSNNRFRDTQYQTTNPPANTEYLLQLQSFTAAPGAYGYGFGNTTAGNNTLEFIAGSQIGHIMRQTDPTCCCGGNKNNF